MTTTPTTTTTNTTSGETSKSTNQSDVTLCPFIISEAHGILCQIWELLILIDNFITNKEQRNRQKRSLSLAETNLIKAMKNIISESFNCCTNDDQCDVKALKISIQTLNVTYFEIKSAGVVSLKMKTQWNTEYVKYNNVSTICRGLELCTPEKHVDKQCLCGLYICNIGESCSAGNCNKAEGCPALKLNRIHRRTQEVTQDNLEFRMVHVNTIGRLASMTEVLDNLESVTKLLKSCDIANLEDGIVLGSFYGGDVTNDTCISCQYKIIRSEGTMFCTPDKHVYKRCQCGTEICDVGDSCTEGSCNRKTVCEERELNRKRRKRGASEGEIMFKMVHINESGKMATVEEVNTTANLVKVKELLEKCDIANLEDGTIEGDGYSGKVTNENCSSCQYKIIKSKGIDFCIAETHVHTTCTCGEDICERGDRCTQVQNVTQCIGCLNLDFGDMHKTKRAASQGGPGKLMIRSYSGTTEASSASGGSSTGSGSEGGSVAGEVHFGIVHINEPGTLATIADIEANKEKVGQLLMKCDIVQVEGGMIGGNVDVGEVTNQTCTDDTCLFQIIKSEGVPFCPRQKHVDRECQCGEETCNIGETCNEGFCNKIADCPVGYHLTKTLRKKNREKRNEQNNKTIPSDEEEFRLVDITSNGPMATIEEIKEKDNFEKVKKMLKKCDVARLVGGFIEGTSDNVNVRKENITDYKYKIIRIEKPPEEEYNDNVAAKCCFIIRSVGENRTYLLTNHSLLHSFPKESCPAGCIYTPYEELDCVDASRICLTDIENYTCCSSETGSICKIYGAEAISNEVRNNIQQNGTCSDICKQIADCSINKTDHWCNDEDLEKEKLSTNSRSRRSTNPDNCTPIVNEPVKQGAKVYPSILPHEPFTQNCSASKSSNKLSFKRSAKSCGFWSYWKFTCYQAYCYPTYYFSQDYYKFTNGGKYFFKHECCSIFQAQCIADDYTGDTYSCPAKG